MNEHQLTFWGPYVAKLGFKDFGTSGMMIISKFYTGPDISQSVAAEQYAIAQRDQFINISDMYQAIVVKDKLTRDDLQQIFMLVTKPYFDIEMVELIKQNKLDVTDEEYWDVVKSIWQRQEFNTSVASRRKNWIKILRHRPKDIKSLEELPDTFTAYRAGDLKGFSWTLDEDKALWFQRRFSQQWGEIPLHEKTFNRDDAVFYTADRGEQEVVIISGKKA